MIQYNYSLDTFKDDPIETFLESQLDNEFHPSISKAYTEYVLKTVPNRVMDIFDWMEKQGATEIAAMCSNDTRTIAEKLQDLVNKAINEQFGSIPKDYREYLKSIVYIEPDKISFPGHETLTNFITDIRN